MRFQRHLPAQEADSTGLKAEHSGMGSLWLTVLLGIAGLLLLAPVFPGIVVLFTNIRVTAIVLNLLLVCALLAWQLSARKSL